MPSRFSHRLVRALGDLALAALNATLLLIALFAFLLWRLAVTADHVASTTAAQVAPLVSGVQEISDGLSETQRKLEAAVQSGVLTDEAGALLVEQSAALTGRVYQTLDTLDPIVAEFRDQGGALVDRAITTGVAEVGKWAARLRGCRADPAALQPVTAPLPSDTG
jgi:hypothetical protein